MQYSKKVLLVADVPSGIAQVQAALGNDYDLIAVSKYLEAEKLVKNQGDRILAVIAGVHFDGSRGVDLLKCVRQKLPNVPVIILQQKRFRHATLQSDAKAICSALGAADFVVTVASTEESSSEEIRQAVKRCVE